MPPLPQEAPESGDSSDESSHPPGDATGDDSSRSALIPPGILSPGEPSFLSPGEHRLVPASGDELGGAAHRSWLAAYMLLWMISLALLLRWAYQDPSLAHLRSSPPLLLAYIARLGLAGVSALVLSFAVPIALVDDSTHLESRWWQAWLWPATLVGMLGTDLVAVGLASIPLLKVLHHE